MNARERLTYVEVPKYDKDTAVREIESDAPDRIVLALLALAFYDTDWRWVQNHCVRLSNNPNDNVRGTAILCLGYIARFRGTLDTELAVPLVIDAMSDPDAFVRGNAADALDDILLFCIPENYDRAKALELLRSERVDDILLGLFGIARSDGDSEFAQGKCFEYSTHPNEAIRGQALKGFATIVYEHRHIDVEKVMRVLSEAAERDGYAAECARSAIECIETYLQADDSD
jgi:hypothetical protein